MDNQGDDMNAISRLTARRSVLAASLLLACGLGMAQDTPGGAAAPASSAVEAAAVATVERMQAFIGALKAYSVNARTTEDEILSFGYKLQNNETVDLLVSEPNSLRVDVAGDDRDQLYLLHDSNFTMLAKRMNVYTQFPIKVSLAEAVGKLLDDGVEMPLIDFIYQGSHGSLLDGVRAGRVVGTSRIDGVLCDHLAFRQSTIDWQLWVAQGDKPLPRKILITTRYEVGDPQFEATLTWDVAPKITATSFAFAPPADARQIEFTASGFAAAATPEGQP
jgi:hypothetical protein